MALEIKSEQIEYCFVWLWVWYGIIWQMKECANRLQMWGETKTDAPTTDWRITVKNWYIPYYSEGSVTNRPVRLHVLSGGWSLVGMRGMVIGLSCGQNGLLVAPGPGAWHHWHRHWQPWVPTGTHYCHFRDTGSHGTVDSVIGDQVNVQELIREEKLMEILL